MSNIVLAEIRDFKRLVLARIKPNETGLTIIGGACAQGKTSIEDGILFGMLGEKYRPTNIRRDGATDNPYIHIELSNGIVIERKGKNSDLLVLDATGKRRNQTFLNDFIDAFALDLRKFLSTNDAERAKILLDILGIGDQLTELDRREGTAYDQRTTIGRDRDRKKKTVDELPQYPGLPATPLSATDLLAKQRAAIETNNENARTRELAARKWAEMDASIALSKQNAERAVENEQRKYDRAVEDAQRAIDIESSAIMQATDKMAELIRQYELEKIKLEQAERRKADADEAMTKVKASNYADILRAESEANTAAFAKELSDNCAKLDAEAAALVDVDTESFDIEIQTIEATNAKIRANMQRAEIAIEAKRLEDEYEAKTREIEAVRAERIALLDNAKFPLPEASIQNGVVHYKGKAWDCTSKAEQLMVATAAARAKAPDFSTVCLDGGEAFDVNTLTKFGEWAAEQGLQIIMTRVSNGPECSIIVEDGIAREQS